MAAKIWTRFTRMSNGKQLKFRIQEVSKDKFESMLGLMFDHYIPEEPVHKASSKYAIFLPRLYGMVNKD